MSGPRTERVTMHGGALSDAACSVYQALKAQVKASGVPKNVHDKSRYFPER